MEVDFNLEKQKLLIRYMLTDVTIFQRCRNILKPSYFDRELERTVEFILSHSEKFSTTPSEEQIQVETGFAMTKVEGMKESDVDYALTNIELFCQTEAVVEAVGKAPDLIEEGNRGQVFDLVKKAMEVGLQKDLGTAYFENPRERLERMKLKSLIPTGWYEIDKKLYGGINRGELTLFTAGSGMGKSLFLQNLSLNWVEGAKYKNWKDEEKNWDSLDVVYITLELSEELSSKRLDTMVTGIDARDIFKRIDDVELKVRMRGKISGHLQIKYMPPGSTCNDISAYLKEYEIQNGKKVDALVVDYIDLLHPNSRRINLSDLFIKDKFVTEELRALASDFDILCASASQLNRTAVDESEHSQAMIAGGISKIQTADNVMSIYASFGMRERGEYSVQFLKTRSSSGVGHKIHVGFDQISLRIFNLDDDFEARDEKEELRDVAASKSHSAMGKSNADILNSIKKGPEKKPVEIEDVSSAESMTRKLQKLQNKNLI